MFLFIISTCILYEHEKTHLDGQRENSCPRRRKMDKARTYWPDKIHFDPEK